MRRGLRATWGVVAAALAGALPAIAADGPALAPCRLRGVPHDAACGVLKRPLDPGRPDGVQIDLHYAVIPALARHKKPDPVFFFAGGPGQSAIDLAGPLSGLLARFLNRRDLVLIDQRGTGRSAALRCEDDDPGRPLAQQLDPKRQLAELARCRAALQALPHGDLRFYTTTIAMQDADAVRRALGVERINAVGGSYGTRAVLEYQRQFPQAVRRMVLDGVAPPDMVLPASFSPDSQAALDAMFAACEATPACAVRHPGLRDRWRSLLAAPPRPVTIVHPVTGRAEPIEITRDALLAMVRAPLYAPALAAGLPQAIDDATAGRFEPLATLASALYGPRRELAPAAGMHFAVICAEDAPRLAGAAEAPGADFGSAFAEHYRAACADWPRGEVPAAFYRLAPAAAPALVLSGGADPATPPRHGERVARALGAKARHVVVAQAGHGVMATGCTRDVLYRFVDAEGDADALAVDASCATGVPRPPAFVPVQPPAASGAAR